MWWRSQRKRLMNADDTSKPDEASVRDRKRGALLGLAIGDALGSAVEFRSRGYFEPVTGYRGGGPHRIAAGEWTDDTSMALALAHSIVESDWDLDDQARRYVEWYRTGRYSVNGRCFDIGLTTASALQQFERTGDSLTSGPTHERTSGNGSIMRLAPVPIAFAHHYPNDVRTLIDRAADSSLPTHGSTQCVSACAAMALILAGLIQGETKDTVLDPKWLAWKELAAYHKLDPKIAEVVAGSWRKKREDEIRGSGHVVACLEAALWAFDTSKTFEEAVLKAVNLGDDADTTGAVCGQLAGACWGESGIPESLLTGLGRRDILDPILTRLVP